MMGIATNVGMLGNLTEVCRKMRTFADMKIERRIDNKISASIMLLMSVLFLGTLTSCEKHDGVYYFNSICTAELNGQTFIDQTPWNISGFNNTPYISDEEYNMEFKTSLSPKRNTPVHYTISIFLFVDSSWEYLAEPQSFNYIKIDDSDNEPQTWVYADYCRKNKISYASILHSDNTNEIIYEIIKKGTFQITTYDLNEGKYKGKFSVEFSEGILTGEFSIKY